jgi:cell cycle arrest protein BUB2
MSSSPTKQPLPHFLPPNANAILSPPSPRAHRVLRRLQSAHSLSTTPTAFNSPSIISQQRLRQRNISTAQKDHVSQEASPQRPATIQSRTRSNSDAAVVDVSNTGPTTRKIATGKRIITPGIMGGRGNTLESLIREGPPGGDVAEALRDMRIDILSDGVKSDSDGMVCFEK